MKIYHIILLISIFSLIQVYKFVAQGNLYLYKNTIHSVSFRIFLQNIIRHLKFSLTSIYTDISIRKMHPPNKPHPDPVISLN
jgi:hypothetical protein